MMKFQAVLADEVYSDIELCWFCCIKIKDKTQAETVLRELGELYPLNEFNHLKRARSIKEELHALVTQVPSPTVPLHPIEHSLEKIASSILSVYVAEVPKNKPLTRKQFLQAKNFWNCSFHEDKRLEKCINDDIFSSEEIQKYTFYMQLANEEKLKALKLGVVNPAGALIVMGSSGEVVATGHTKPNHPLKHAVMDCIDQVARTQGGGAWTNEAKPSILQELSDVPYKLQPASLEESCFPAVKRAKAESYLCTGYDLFTTVEPCLMCSMALVHSRIKRVFYAEDDTLGGGLGSRYKIHCNEKINHHFEVYNVKKP